MRQRFMQFMQGRYGVDTLNRVITWFLFGIIIVNLFIRSNLLNLISFLLLIYLYFRMFSRNYSKRYRENQWFMSKFSPVQRFFFKQKNHAIQRKSYRLYKCPKCRQMVRVPKGKGRIAIRCPKCQEEFIRRS